MDRDPWLFGRPLTDNWFECLPLSELTEGQGCSVIVNGRSIALFLVDGTVLAVAGSCPHAGAPLNRGWIEDGSVVVCPLHWWKFRLTTGECLTDSRQSISTFLARVDVDGIVWVKKQDEQFHLNHEDNDGSSGHHDSGND